MRDYKKEAEIFRETVHLHFLKLHQTMSSVGLGKGQPPVLHHLSLKDGCMQSEIAKCERKTPATTTVMLQTMEKNGLIERRSDPEDLRRIRVYITDKGREAEKSAMLALAKMDEDIYSVFTDDEYDEFFRLLNKMNDRMKELLDRKGPEQ